MMTTVEQLQSLTSPPNLSRIDYGNVRTFIGKKVTIIAPGRTDFY